MKNKITNLALGLALLLCSMVPARAQVIIEDAVVPGGSSFISQPHELAGVLSGVKFFTLRFAPVNGTLSTCAAAADSLLRPAEWVQAGAAASQNCASAGTFSTTSALSANQVRLSVGTVGNGSVRVQLVGCVARCSVAAGAAVWGSIAGTLSDQTDLNTALASAGAIKVATLTLTAAQIKTAKATPVQLIAAPGIGKYLAPFLWSCQYKFVTTAYAQGLGGSRLNPFFGNSSVNAGWPLVSSGAASMLTQTASTVDYASQGLIDANDPQASLENQAINIKNDGTDEWITGDGTLTVTVYYTVVTLQ